MIPGMNQSSDDPKNKTPSLWQAIVLLIIFTIGAVTLFGIMVYMLLSGAEQLGLPFVFQVAIFVVVSGVFAWLLKRITDIGTGMARAWFPEEDDN